MKENDKTLIDFFKITFAVILFIAAVIGPIYILINFLIDSKINDPAFVDKVALKVMIPSVVFDENEKVLSAYPQGAYDEYISNIEVVKDDKSDVQEIIFYPKKFLNLAPTIESLDANMEFNVERINQIDWKYRVKKLSHTPLLAIGNKTEGEPSVKRFKITVIR